MELNATHQLHIVRHHVPVHFLAGDRHLGPQQAARRLTSGCESFRQQRVEDIRDRRPKLGFHASAPINAAQIVVDLFALRRIARDTLAVAELGDPRLDAGRYLTDLRAKLLGLTA